MELERAYGQTRAACQIVRQVSALGSLKEMGAFLLKKVKEQAPCALVSLLAFNAIRDTLFVISDHGLAVLRDPQLLNYAQKYWVNLLMQVSRANLSSKRP